MVMVVLWCYSVLFSFFFSLLVNPICVEPRADDPFKTEVCKIMSSIEDIMKQCEGEC